MAAAKAHVGGLLQGSRPLEADLKGRGGDPCNARHARLHDQKATTDKKSTLIRTNCAIATGVVLIGKFDGEFAAHSSTYAGTGTVRYTW